MRLFSFLYNTGLGLFALFSLPKMFKNREKYKNILKSKWGESFKDIQKSSPLIWIHAVSLGETKAVSGLASLIKKRYPETHFLITNVTETGHAEAKKSIPFADHYLFLPFDFSWIMDPIVKRLKPDLVILSEGDYWYHFVQAAKDGDAQVVIVNGKLSERSQNRYSYLGGFLKSYFSPVDLYCLQSERYSERFQSLGVPKEKLIVTGNLKLDAPIKRLQEEELTSWRKKLFLHNGDLVLVAGSTHAPEEELILNAYQELVKDFPRLKLLLVPRHPERFNEVEALISKYPFKHSRFSQIQKAEGNEPIILMDAMGILNTCYQLSTLAIVCGSFTEKVGGHNILEPCMFGKPVVFGPYMHTQMDYLHLVLEHKAGLQVTHENLKETLKQLLNSPKECAKLGASGLKLIQDTQGASLRTLDLLEERFQLSRRFTLREKA